MNVARVKCQRRGGSRNSGPTTARHPMWLEKKSETDLRTLTLGIGRVESRLWQTKRAHTKYPTRTKTGTPRRHGHTAVTRTVVTLFQHVDLQKRSISSSGQLPSSDPAVGDLHRRANPSSVPIEGFRLAEERHDELWNTMHSWPNSRRFVETSHRENRICTFCPTMGSDETAHEPGPGWKQLGEA